MKHGGIALLTLSMLGCGGSPSNNTPISPAIVVANDTQLSAMWVRQENWLANNNFVLNAAAVAVQGVTPDIFPPDSRATGVSSQGVTVTLIPDLTVAQLQAENPGVTLRHNTDPTGVIHCPSNSEGAKYCAAYVQGSSISVAASLEFDDGATGYEMENVILSRLGYDTSRR